MIILLFFREPCITNATQEIKMTGQFKDKCDEALAPLLCFGSGRQMVRRSGQAGQVGWENVATCDNEMTPPEDLDSMLEEDPTQLYLSVLFSPGAFLPSSRLSPSSVAPWTEETWRLSAGTDCEPRW